jgi:mannosylglycoprotein endo-beta-mannosidase
VEDKEEFLAEFAQLCTKCTGAAVIGGDFNIIRKTTEKNKPCVLPRWSHIFNSIIELNGLKEIRLLGRQYTWVNNLPDPTYEKLDRVLVTAEWDQAFPLALI